MDLRQLEYFLKVAQRKNISTAASELNITQPTLTKSIRLLEEQLGVKLFDRLPRGVALTLYGATLLRHAEAVHVQIKDAGEEVAALRKSAAPITIVINQSPWFDSFRKTVELYEKETGNKVELDVNPFAGSLEKQRNSVRASKGQYDLLIMNSGWFAEMYFGGFIEPINDIDSSFKLDPDVYTLGDTVYLDAAKKIMVPTGKLMSVPISPLIPLVYYRGEAANPGCLQLGRYRRQTGHGLESPFW